VEVCGDDSGILWYLRRSYVVFNYVEGGGISVCYRCASHGCSGNISFIPSERDLITLRNRT